MAQPQLPARNGTVQNHWSQTSDDLSTLCISRGIEPAGLKKEEKIVLLGFYDMDASQDVVEKWEKQVSPLTTLKHMGAFALKHDIALSNPTSRPATLTEIISGVINIEKRAQAVPPPRPVTPQDHHEGRPSPFSRRRWQTPVDPILGRTSSTRPSFFSATRREAQAPIDARSRDDPADIQSVMDSLSLGSQTVSHETRDQILQAVSNLLKSGPARSHSAAGQPTSGTLMSEDIGAAWTDAVESLGDCAVDQAQVIEGVQRIGTSQYDLAQQMRRNVEKLQLLHTVVDQVARDTRELVSAMEATAARSLELAEDVQNQGAGLHNRAERRYREAKALFSRLWKK